MTAFITASRGLRSYSQSAIIRQGSMQAGLKQATVPGLAGVLSNRYRFDQIPDQSKKNAIVTGGSAGIGANIAYGLALKGARVIILCATPEHGEKAVKEIKEKIATDATKDAQVEFRIVDLGQLKQVKSFAEQMKQELSSLDLLINNAGIGASPGGLTEDGLGNHFQVNHLSHMLLTTELLPLLEKSDASPRIVFQSSELHRAAPSDVKFESVEEMDSTDKEPTKMYGRSKLMNILFAKQLAKRKLTPEGNRILAIAVHPGCVATGQEWGAAEAYGPLGTALVAGSRLVFMGADQGAESALWAATAKEVAEEPAKYQGSYLRQPDDSLGNESNQAQDEKLGESLWTLSKQVLKDRLGYDISY